MDHLVRSLAPLALPRQLKTRERAPKGLFILFEDTIDLIYSSEVRQALKQTCDFIAPPLSREAILDDIDLLGEVEVLFSGWGGPKLNERFLRAAPNLKIVFYGAGSVRPIVTDAFWESGIPITSAYAANAHPVAEYTLATILLSLRNFWSYARQTPQGLGWGDHTRHIPGGFRSTVGLVSLGMIGRKVLSLLQPFDVQILAYCPFLTPEEATELGIEKCGLDELFSRSDVISLHTPQLPETIGMVNARQLSLMKDGATLINTARGAIIEEADLIRVFRERPSLQAVLDVCEPEPPSPDSGLLTLPNIILTPHIAGSLGPECARLGHYMLEEFRRYVQGEPLRWRLTREQVEKMA